MKLKIDTTHCSYFLRREVLWGPHVTVAFLWWTTTDDLRRWRGNVSITPSAGTYGGALGKCVEEPLRRREKHKNAEEKLRPSDTIVHMIIFMYFFITKLPIGSKTEITELLVLLYHHPRVWKHHFPKQKQLSGQSIQPRRQCACFILFSSQSRLSWLEGPSPSGRIFQPWRDWSRFLFAGLQATLLPLVPLKNVYSRCCVAAE